MTPPLTQPATAQDLPILLAKISTEIKQQQEVMAAGGLGELGPLGPLLAEMTGLLNQLNPADVKSCEATLDQINHGLAQLSDAYKNQRDAAQAGMSELSTRMRAATAYTHSNLSAPPAPLTIIPTDIDNDGGSPPSEK